MTPGTATVLSHVHYEDRDEAFAVLAKMTESQVPVSAKLRIVDVHGRIRHVVLLGSRAINTAGLDIRTSGLYIDITEPYGDEIETAVASHLQRMTTAQPRIEQATGMLMLMYGIPASQALDLLVWRSRETDCSVRTIADRLIESVRNDHVVAPALRERFDHLLLTAHTPSPDAVWDVAGAS